MKFTKIELGPTHIEHINRPFPCYFGIDKTYKLFGHPFGLRLKTKIREFYCLCFGKKVFSLYSRRLPLRYATAAIRNDSCDASNLYEISRLPPNKQRVLFVIDSLALTGGVERRLLLQFEWLERHGICPIIVSKEQLCPALKKYPRLRLFGDAPNAEEKLVEFIRWTGAVTVEFNMKSATFFNGIDLTLLKQFVRIGCMIHSKVRADPEQLAKLDYRCCSVRYNTYQNVEKIPNVVRFPEKYPVYDSKSRRALYIGRIDSEKLPTLKAFICICQLYSYKFDIAGPINWKQKDVALFLRKIDPASFLGVINTPHFLAEKGGQYAFVGGVGQVPLEAAAANLPTLVTSHLEDPRTSLFLTDDTIEVLLDRNCVVKTLDFSLKETNIDAFFKAKSTAELNPSEADQQLKHFRMRETLKLLRDEEHVWNRYLHLLIGK